MNASDVVVLPFRDILTSDSAILAMSFGKPVITPAIGCTLDILKDSRNFPYNPSNNLFKAIQCVMREHTKNLVKIGKRNFKFSERFQWMKIAKRTYEVYKPALRLRNYRDTNNRTELKKLNQCLVRIIKPYQIGVRSTISSDLKFGFPLWCKVSALSRNE